MKNILRDTALVTLAAAALYAAAPHAGAQTPAAPANSPSSGMTDEQFSQIYSDMDTNKDGYISRAEYLNYYGTTYDRWDSGRKGMLSRSDIRTRMFERELRKTDGNPQGNSPLPGSVQKR